MKKLLCILLAVLTVLPFGTAAAKAIIPTAWDSIETFEDGSYLILSGAESEGNEAEPVTNLFAWLMNLLKKLFSLLLGIKESTREVSGEKYLSYYSSDGTLLWTVTLKAKFRYSDVFTECVDAQLSAQMFDRDWQLVSSDCSKNGNSASASFTVRQTKLGIPLKSITKELVLTCDTNGKLQ